MVVKVVASGREGAASDAFGCEQRALARRLQRSKKCQDTVLIFTWDRVGKAHAVSLCRVIIV